MGIELANDKFCGQDYLVRLLGSAERAMHRVTRAVAPFGICFAPSKCKAPVQNCTTLIPELIVNGEEVTTVDRFIYLLSCLIKDGSTVRSVRVCMPHSSYVLWTKALVIQA